MVSTVVLAVTSARGLPSPFNHNYTTKYYCTFPSSAYGTRVLSIRKCVRSKQSCQCHLPCWEHHSLPVKLMTPYPFFFFPTWNQLPSQKTCCRVNEHYGICSNLKNKRIYRGLCPHTHKKNLLPDWGER